MLTDEVLDEDIEALLYAQVYYGKSKESDLTGTQQIDLNKEGTNPIGDSETQKESTYPDKKGLSRNVEQKNEDNYSELQPPLDSHISPGSSNNQSKLDYNVPPDNSEKPDIISKSQNQNRGEVPQQQYIEISTSTPFTDSSEKNPTQIVAQIPLPTASGNVPNQQLLNNITINQYIYPQGEDFLNRLKSFREKIVWSKQCDKDLKRLQKGKINESDFFRILEKRLTWQNIKRQQQQHTIRKVFLKRQQKIASSAVICLSDSDNSDVEFVSIETTAKPVGKNQAVAMKAKVNMSTESMSVDDSADEDDDEIIYVEPPPVPIINVEDESDSEASEKNSVTESATQELPSEKQPSQDLDDASNDFLAPTHTSDDFNFSLHGSEFHDAEFIKPANPTDHYETETESTTSTSDFHRDSSRESRPSISTIVFNEVDFPKEDIFDGSNLDKFSELITPNRANIASGDKGDENGDQESSRSRKKVKPRTSSESSSESDYDSVETHKNLPVLTPMVCADSSPSTSNKSKTKFGENDKKNKEPSSSGKRSRKSKRGNFSDDNDGILDVEQSEKVMESRKNKRRRSGSPLDDDVPKRKAKKKKKKSGNTSADQDDLIKDSATPERNLMRRSRRDGTQSSWIVTSTPRFSMPISDDQVDLTFRRSSKKKKKRGRNIDLDKDDERKPNTSQQDSVNFEDTAVTRSKRKEDINKSDQVIIELAHDNREESNKKKSKKRKSNKTAGAAEDADVTSNQQNEISSVTLEEAHENGTPGDIEENSKKKTKKRKQKMLSDNRIPTEDANNTADQEGILEVTSEVSNLEGHEGVASEDNVDKQGKDKRKKRNSSEKKMSVEDKTGNVEKIKDQQETKGGKDILEEGESETSARENGTPGDIEENTKRKTKKRKQKMLSDNRIPTEDANNTADQEGILEVTSEVSNLEGHEGVASEDNVDSQRKEKRKKRNSSEKRMSVEDKPRNVEKNKDQQETKDGKDILEDTLDILEDTLDILEEDILEEGEPETSARENGTPGDIEENTKRKTKKRKQKMLSDNRIPTEDANNTAECILEDKRMSVEDKTGTVEKNKDQQETKDGKDILEDILDILEEDILEEGDSETSVAEKVALENQNDDEDVIIIEQEVPVHTIESSDSENDDDFINSDIPDDTLELANISTGANKDVTDEGAHKANENTSDFDLQSRLSKMSDDPEKWKILPTDRYNVSGNRGPRCRKCRQIGHIERHCPNKPVIPSCTLCGHEGHQEPRCPNKVCFNCAEPNNYSPIFCHKCSKKRYEKCSLCGLLGHLRCVCPDLWRRYYLTTKEGPPIRASKKQRVNLPRKKRWCSGCAEKGHLEHECNSFKWIREYPVSLPFIIKYDDVYGTEKKADNSTTDLRMKLLQNRSRNDRSLDDSSSNSQPQPTLETPIDEPSNATQEITPESLNTTSESTTAPAEPQNKTVVEDVPNEQLTHNSEPSINVQPPQPENEENLVLNFEPPVNTDIVLESQSSEIPKTYKRLSPPKEALYFPRRAEELQRLRRTTDRPPKKKYGKAKLNPLSMLNRPAEPPRFTPYQSVLNPCSMLGTSTNALPSLMDVPVPVIDNAGDPMLNNVLPEHALAPAPLRLFNSVPNNILAQQVANIVSSLPAFQGMQHMNQGFAQDFAGNDFFQGYQYGSQIPPNPGMYFDPPPRNYIDFSGPPPDERYFEFNAPENNYVNRDFLDMPYTITSEPSPELLPGFRNPQHTLPLLVNEDFTGRSRDNMNSNAPGFIALSVGQQENLDTFPSGKLNNVEEVTLKKILNSSLELLVEFINTEIEKLDAIKNPDAKMYKKKLNNIDQLKKIEIKPNAVKKQIYFLYKHINMFLFGIHKLGEGHRNLDFLRNFVRQPGRHVPPKKRSALLEAYGYIFGGEHPTFDYRKRLDILSCGQKRGT